MYRITSDSHKGYERNQQGDRIEVQGGVCIGALDMAVRKGLLREIRYALSSLSGQPGHHVSKTWRNQSWI